MYYILYKLLIIKMNKLRIPIENYYEDALFVNDRFNIFDQKEPETWTIVITNTNENSLCEFNCVDISIFTNDEWEKINRIKNDMNKSNKYWDDSLWENFSTELRNECNFFDDNISFDDVRTNQKANQIYDIFYKEFEQYQITINETKKYIEDNYDKMTIKT